MKDGRIINGDGGLSIGDDNWGLPIGDDGGQGNATLQTYTKWKSFADELEASIRKDIEPGNSWVAAMKPDGPPILGAVNGAIESVSRSLPIFDIWPYRSTSVYQLKPGATPIKPGGAGFYENYEPLGSFPDVVSRKRRWQVIMISSFMGFITPVL